MHRSDRVDSHCRKYARVLLKTVLRGTRHNRKGKHQPTHFCGARIHGRTVKMTPPAPRDESATRNRACRSIDKGAVFDPRSPSRSGETLAHLSVLEFIGESVCRA